MLIPFTHTNISSLDHHSGASTPETKWLHNAINWIIPLMHPFGVSILPPSHNNSIFKRAGRGTAVKWAVPYAVHLTFTLCFSFCTILIRILLNKMCLIVPSNQVGHCHCNILLEHLWFLSFAGSQIQFWIICFGFKMV